MVSCWEPSSPWTTLFFRSLEACRRSPERPRWRAFWACAPRSVRSFATPGPTCCFLWEFFFILFLLRLVVKKDWIAAIVIVFLGAVTNTGGDYFWSTFLFSAVI